MNIIEIKNLNFRYTRKYPVIRDLNLSIKKGEYVYILCGENPGTKLEKAKKLGITIISERDFYNLLNR